MNKIDEINIIILIFFRNNFFFDIKKQANKPTSKKIELWINPWEINKLVIYDKIVINKIPLKPNSPRESLIDKSLEDKYPKPIIENKIIK